MRAVRFGWALTGLSILAGCQSRGGPVGGGDGAAGCLFGSAPNPNPSLAECRCVDRTPAAATRELAVDSNGRHASHSIPARLGLNGWVLHI